MIYAYIRVSTDKQTIDNQLFAIEKFCDGQKIKVNRYITETISGAKDFAKRRLGRLIKQLQTGDILIASEMSRFGRNLLQILTILNLCMEKGVEVWTIKDNYRLGCDIQSKVLAFAFGLIAEIERNLISQRTREALARIKAEGRKLGRKSGSQNKKHILYDNKDKVFTLLKRGIPKTTIAKIIGCSAKTIYNARLANDNFDKYQNLMR